MRTISLNFKSGKISVDDIPTPKTNSNSVLVANHNSLISSGTEGYVINMARKGPIGKAMDRPDLAKQVIDKALVEGFFNTARVVKNLITAPLPLGYSCAGEVIESGSNVDLFSPGDRVACAGLGMANHAEQIIIPQTMAARIPDNVTFKEAAFGTLGAISLHGVRLANPELGETFAVFGLGLLGQLTLQILSASGCNAIGFDIDERKVNIAKGLGFRSGLIGKDNVEEVVNGETGGLGADGVILTAHSNKKHLINTAADVCRVKGRIIAVGLVNLDIPRRKFFEKEIRLEISRAYGAGAYDSDYEKKGIDYPPAYVRWTQGRNLKAFIDLIARKKVNVEPLITHQFTLEDANKAYDLVVGKKRELFIGVLFEYNPLKSKTNIIQLDNQIGQLNPQKKSLNFGVIGAGRFAQGILLPSLTSHHGVEILGVVTGSGMSAKHVAKKYNGSFCAPDYERLLECEDIGSVLIATRHNLHSQIIIAAMQKQKNIFVEKPLAVNLSQLEQIVTAQSKYEGILLIGFNRRFSPICQKIQKKYLSLRKLPLVVSYRFITPRITKGHESEWVHDSKIGGGRIVGEVCHMIDTASFLIDSSPVRVYASTISADTPSIPVYDNISITVDYADGSIAQLLYVANSDASLPQEKIELHWEGACCMIDNFKSGFYSFKGKRKRMWHVNQQKGWNEEISAFVENLKGGSSDLIPFHSIVETTATTFAIQQSIQTGSVVNIDKILKYNQLG